MLLEKGPTTPSLISYVSDAKKLLFAGDLPPDVTCNQDTHQLTLNSKDDVIVLTEADFTPITVTREQSAVSCAVC